MLTKKSKETAKRTIQAVASATVVVLSVVATPLHAALPAGDTSAITDAQANIAEGSGLVVTVIVVIAGFFWLRRLFH